MARDVLPPQVAALLQGGNKIAAIKELRNITGLGLKQAKDWLDNYERGMSARLPEPMVPSGDKIVRQLTSLGLAEAKKRADSRKHTGREHGLSPGQVAPSGGAGKWLVLIVVAVVAIGSALYL